MTKAPNGFVIIILYFLKCCQLCGFSVQIFNIAIFHEPTISKSSIKDSNVPLTFETSKIKDDISDAVDQDILQNRFRHDKIVKYIKTTKDDLNFNGDLKKKPIINGKTINFMTKYPNFKSTWPTHESKNPGIGPTLSRSPIFIDVGTLKTHSARSSRISTAHIYPMSSNYIFETNANYKRMHDNIKLTTKSSAKRTKNLFKKETYNSKIFRGTNTIFTKRSLRPHQEMKLNFGYRKQYDQNESPLDVKKKVLTRLHELENSIKLVKSQILNDTRTISDLQNQIDQKEKERTKLNLIKEKGAVVEKVSSDKQREEMFLSTFNVIPDFEKHSTFDNNRVKGNKSISEEKHLTFENEAYNGPTNKFGMSEDTRKDQDKEKYHRRKYRSHQKAETRDVHGHSLEKHTDSFMLTPNTNHIGIENLKDMLGNINLEDHNKQLQMNTSYRHNYITSISHEENDQNNTETTPSIFELDEALETFENFDGEFDWAKFFTSNMYYELLKNSTATSMDGRRMVNEPTTPMYHPELPPLDKALKARADFWNDYVMDTAVTAPRQAIIFASSLPTRTILVPRPGDKILLPESAGITSQEFRKPINDEIDLKYDNNSNIGLSLLHRRRILPGDQYLNPVDSGRRHLQFSTTSSDNLLNDPIIRDIDEAIGF